jgi:carbamate kinase
MSESKKKVAVIAVGGNSLIKDKDHRTIPDQYAAASESMAHIAGMIEQGWDVVISHGNGPQVGFILRRSELSAHELHTVALDYCVADTQGSIGYMFQRALHNEFKRRGIDKQAATVITQVRVEVDDPAFENPSKPIGTFMDEAKALKHKEEDGWQVVEDAGRGWRRVVPSPKPIEIMERATIESLINEGFIVISGGGGGIPVVADPEQGLLGVEAVIDKDFASSLLASGLGADLFLISTAVEKVAINFNQPNETWLDSMTMAQAKEYMDAGHFAPGSMKPKIQAVLNFLEAGGKEALITNPENLEKALRGETGTRITA